MVTVLAATGLQVQHMETVLLILVIMVDIWIIRNVYQAVESPLKYGIFLIINICWFVQFGHL